MSVISLVSALLSDIPKGSSRSAPDGHGRGSEASGQHLLSFSNGKGGANDTGGAGDARPPRTGFPVLLDQHLQKGAMPADEQWNQFSLSGLLPTDTLDPAKGGMSLPPERPNLPLAYNTLPFAEPMSLNGEATIAPLQTQLDDRSDISDLDLLLETDVSLLSDVGSVNISTFDSNAANGGTIDAKAQTVTLAPDVPDEMVSGDQIALGDPGAQEIASDDLRGGASEWLPGDAVGPQFALADDGSRTVVLNEATRTADDAVWSGPVLAANNREPVMSIAESATASARPAEALVPIALSTSVRGLMQRFSEQFAGASTERGVEGPNLLSSELRAAPGNVQLSGFAQHLIQQQSAQNQRAVADAELQQILNPSRQQGAGTELGAGDRFFQSAGGAARWSEGLNQSIALLASRGSHTAHIQLDPPELGKLMIRIQVTGDQASINFASPHVAVRDALESGASRLQDLLSEQGLSLKDMDVSDQQSGDRRQTTAAAEEIGQEEDGIDETSTLRVLSDAAGLIDDYA